MIEGIEGTVIKTDTIVIINTKTAVWDQEKAGTATKYEPPYKHNMDLPIVPFDHVQPPLVWYDHHYMDMKFLTSDISVNVSISSLFPVDCIHYEGV